MQFNMSYLLYIMHDLFEKFFAKSSIKRIDYYEFERISYNHKFFFEERPILDIQSVIDSLILSYTKSIYD